MKYITGSGFLSAPAIGFFLLSFLPFSLNAQSLVPCNCGEEPVGKRLYGYCDSFFIKDVIKCQFDSAYAFSGGLARVLKAGKTGYVDPAGKLVIPAVYDWGLDFSDGLALVKKGSSFIYINKTGASPFKKAVYVPSPPVPPNLSESVLKMLKSQEEERLRTLRFSDGLAIVIDSANRSFGYIDVKGNLVIPTRYAVAFPFLEGVALVRESPAAPFLIINKKGEKQGALPADYVPVGEGFQDGFLRVMARPNYDTKDFRTRNYVDKKGQFLLGEPVISAEPFVRGFAVIKNKDGEFVLINRQGKQAFPEGYNYLEPSGMRGIYYYNRMDGKGYGLIDTAGKIRSKVGYVNFKKISDTVFLCKPWGTSTYTLLSVKSGDLFGGSLFTDYSWRMNGKNPVLQLSGNRSVVPLELDYEPATGKFFKDGKELAVKDNYHLAVNSSNRISQDNNNIFSFENRHFRLKFAEGMELFKDTVGQKVYRNSTFFFSVEETDYRGSAGDYINAMETRLRSGGKYEKVEAFRLATEWGSITYLLATQKKVSDKHPAVFFYAALDEKQARPDPGKLYVFYGNYFLTDERIHRNAMTSILYSLKFK